MITNVLLNPPLGLGCKIWNPLTARISDDQLNNHQHHDWLHRHKLLKQHALMKSPWKWPKSHNWNLSISLQKLKSSHQSLSLVVTINDMDHHHRRHGCNHLTSDRLQSFCGCLTGRWHAMAIILIGIKPPPSSSPSSSSSATPSSSALLTSIWYQRDQRARDLFHLKIGKSAH